MCSTRPWNAVVTIRLKCYSLYERTLVSQEGCRTVTRDTRIDRGPFGPIVRPATDGGPTVVYLHHGHDVSAGPEAALDVASRLAARTGSTVLCARYRPAYPDALQDVEAAYRSFPEGRPTVLAGERV